MDDAGHFTFTTVDPGPTREGGAPFILVCVFARGLLDRVFTRAYLPESDALGEDPLLSSVEESRRGTLIAQRESDGGSCSTSPCRGGRDGLPVVPADSGPERSSSSGAEPVLMAPSSLFTPAWANTRAAETLSEQAFVDALLDVEAAWGAVLAEHGFAERSDAEELTAICADRRQLPALAPEQLAEAAAGGGNPVIPLLKALRAELAERGAGDSALHRGATSQDILDTAVVLLCLRAARHAVEDARAAAASWPIWPSGIGAPSALRTL